MNKIIIQKNNSGERIDKFLSSFAKASADKGKEFFANGKVTRGEIIRNIKNGNILINNKTAKPSYLLKEGDGIEINIPDNIINLLPNKEVKFEIIHQNKNFIVINKPAGVLVHPGHKKENNTLVNGLLHRFLEIGNVGDEPDARPGIVHRLDRDTSGIMLVARNLETFLELKKRFKNREMQKIYWAVVAGVFAKQERLGIINKSLAKAVGYKNK